jgi:hypothetical protein
MLILRVFALVSAAANALRLRGDCPYDSMHTSGGQNSPCGYDAVPVATVSIAGSSTPAFQVDGAHLTSVGALKYMKSRKGMSPTDFLSCSSPPCTELNIKTTR